MHDPTPGDFEIPPQIVCSRCARTECEGCAQQPPTRSTLAWERSISPRSLWNTALQTIHDEQTWVLEVDEGRVGRALGFALLAEALAALSFCPLIALVWLGLARLELVELPTLTHIAPYSAGVALAFAALLLGLHLLFGLSLELQAAALGKRRAARGAQVLALYCCGWDLLTSPLGLVLAALGWQGARVGDLRRATTAPRAALTRYLVQVRAVSERRAPSVVISSFALSIFELMLVAAGGIGYWLSAM